MSDPLPGRWTPSNRDRLSALLAGMPAMREAAPCAVFDFDNTCIQHDIGEAFHRFMATGPRYLPSILDRLDGEDGRAKIARLWQDPSANRDALRDAIVAAYWRHLARIGNGPTYQWQVTLLAGMAEAEVEALAAECVASVAVEAIGLTEQVEEDGFTVAVEHGVRPYPEIRALFRALESAGVEVWICSASSRWLVSAAAEAWFDIPSERVLAAAVEIDDGVLTSRNQTPTPYHEGKVALIEQHIGLRPVLVAGDSGTDWEMLECGENVLFIDKGSTPDLVERANALGWWVQPAFHRAG